MSIKSYTELMNLGSYDERLEYLRTRSNIGVATFGGHRYLNQAFYSSPEWKQFRNKVILRDEGCDLACPDRPINIDYIDHSGTIRKSHEVVIIHHINPVTVDDILNRNPCLFDMNNVITTTRSTHNLIHYGEEKSSTVCIERTANDQCPWR